MTDNTDSIDILRQNRKLLEQEIASFLNEKINEFVRQNRVHIYEINIEFARENFIGSRDTVYAVWDVTVHLSI